jgi:hypothetical protein
MWLWRHLDKGFAHAQLRANGKIGGGYVQFDYQVVAGRAKRLAVRYQFGDILSHDGKLRFETAWHATIPFIARDAFFSGQLNRA